MRLRLRDSVSNVVITTAAKAIAVALISLPTALFAETKSETETKLKLLKVIPEGVYSNETDFICPLYHVTVVGENLPAGDALKVFVNDRQVKVVQLEEDTPPRRPTKAQESSAEEKAGPPPEAYIQNPGDGSQFELWINRLVYSGVVELRVGMTNPVASPAATPNATPSATPSIPPGPNSGTAATPTPTATPAASVIPRVIKSNKLSLTLARNGNTTTDRRFFRVVVFLIALFVLILPIILMRRVIKAQITAGNNDEAAVSGGRSQLEQWLTALFLDRETATYSLSKFQFYIWTAASVMAYFYLAASRAYVQGVWTFIAIPDNLPGIVFISATTGALAVVATNSRGPKGAGDMHPSLADFVSSGGVVAVERVQFFIWTIIGALVFLWLSLVQTPVDILELPKIPESFLQLMGISSLGYLSGKFARKAGPIINDVSVKLGTFVPDKKEGDAAAPESRGATIITIRGRILSPDADFKITYETKDKTTPAKEVALTDHFAPLKTKIIDTDDQTSGQNKTAKKLELTIDQPALEWLDGATMLLISNPDGQTASWGLPRLPKITGEIKAELVPPDPQSLKLTLTGLYLAKTATYVIDDKPVIREQLPPAAIEVVTPDEKAPQQFANSLKLTISKPDRKWIDVGKHQLTIKNSEEMTADGYYQIPASPAPVA
jgi:hypothetical protein